MLEHFTDEQRKQFSGLLELAMTNLTDKKIEARRICRMCDEGVRRKVDCPVESAIK